VSVATAGTCTKQALFEAGRDGYTTCRIPGIVVTKAGTALAHCEARKGEGGDWDPIDIRMRRSTDGGVTWDAARTVVDHAAYGHDTIDNFVLVPDRDTGEVHALFCVEYHQAYYMKSADDGVTFSEPVEITSTFDAFRPEYDWGVLAVGPGHGIQLSNGRLLAPVWISESRTKAHRPNRAAVIYSDDHGATWERGDIVPREFPNLNETEAVELVDGRVLLNMRVMDDGRERPDDEMRRAITTSDDGAHGWDTPRLDPALVEPVCFGSICRHSTAREGKRDRILFSNPDSLEVSLPGCWKGVRDRKNLTIRMSYDECGTWPVSKVLEPGPSGYSDLAVARDGTIMCLYECGMIADRMARSKELTLARFDLAWLTGGRDE